MTTQLNYSKSDQFLNRLKADFMIYHATQLETRNDELLIKIANCESPACFAELLRDHSHDYLSLCYFFGAASDDDPAFDSIIDDDFSQYDDPAAAVQQLFNDTYADHTNETWTGPLLIEYDT